MVIKYNVEVQDKDIKRSIDRLTDQIFKLLPCREEGKDWKAPMQNLIIEIGGTASLLEDQMDLFRVMAKLEGALSLDKENDFLIFRTTIFECLSLMNKVKQWIV